jgi:phage/plasmid-like protein (TIGR03299 family)
MAHELSQRADGFVEMAFNSAFGGRDAIWHRLGNELPEDASMDDWSRMAGMDWVAIPTPVTFNTPDGVSVFDNQQVIYRSDTEAPLSIVSGKYKIIQPREVLDFFQDMIDMDGMKLTTAGVLYGGKRFWAMADTGREFDARDGDTVNGKILLTTSLDGTLATQAMFTSVRVVCNNTLRFAVNGQTRGKVRVTHRSVFNPKELKKKMGLFDAGFENFRDTIRMLAATPIAEPQVDKLLTKLLQDPNKKPDEQPRTIPGRVDVMKQLFARGVGNKGESYWDVVNAVTEYVDHGAYGRLPDTQAWDAWYGPSADLKSRAFELAVEEAEAA